MDTWIISSYDYLRHKTLESAEREANRIREEEPHKFWRIYRVKTTLPAANTKAVLKAADNLCAYVGYNLDSIKDPYLVALVAKLQYEVHFRNESMKDEVLEDAWLETVNA